MFLIAFDRCQLVCSCLSWVYPKLCLHWIQVKHGSPQSWEVTLKSASNLKNAATTGDTNIDHQLSLQIILKIGKMAWHPRSKITVQEIKELSPPTLISSFLSCSRLLLSMVTQPWLSLLFKVILGLGDPLGKEMATHSSNLAWKIPRTEEPEGLQFMGHKELDTNELLHFMF